MKIEKINQQYLRIAADEECEKGERLYAARVLHKKSIDGLMSLTRRSMDGKEYYYCSIEGLHSMEEIWDGRFLTENELDSFLLDLGETVLALEELLLKQEQVCLNPAYIMYDVAKRKWKFLCLVETYCSQSEDTMTLLDFLAGKLGRGGIEDKKLYEYLADCMQFEGAILPAELVRIWKARMQAESQSRDAESRTTQEQKEDCGKETKDLMQTLIEQNTQPEEAECLGRQQMPSGKEIWNEIVYRRLYQVPFCPH